MIRPFLVNIRYDIDFYNFLIVMFCHSVFRTFTNLFYIINPKIEYIFYCERSLQNMLAYTYILLILLRFSDFIIIISLVKFKEKIPADLIKDLFDGYIDRIILSYVFTQEFSIKKYIYCHRVLYKIIELLREISF